MIIGIDAQLNNEAADQLRVVLNPQRGRLHPNGTALKPRQTSLRLAPTPRPFGVDQVLTTAKMKKAAFAAIVISLYDV